MWILWLVRINIITNLTLIDSYLQACKFTANVPWLKKTGSYQAARLTSVHRQKALSRAQPFGSHPPLACQAGLFAQPTTRDYYSVKLKGTAASQKKVNQRSSDSETEWNRSLWYCVKYKRLQALVVGPVTTRVTVIALWALAREEPFFLLIKPKVWRNLASFAIESLLLSDWVTDVIWSWILGSDRRTQINCDRQHCVTGFKLESGAREETRRFSNLKRCVATGNRIRVSGISLLRHNRSTIPPARATELLTCFRVPVPYRQRLICFFVCLLTGKPPQVNFNAFLQGAQGIDSWSE